MHSERYVYRGDIVIPSPKRRTSRVIHLYTMCNGYCIVLDLLHHIPFRDYYHFARVNIETEERGAAAAVVSLHSAIN